MYSFQLLDVSTGHEEWVMDEAHKEKILHCYFSSNGERIVSCGESDGKHKVCNMYIVCKNTFAYVYVLSRYGV